MKATKKVLLLSLCAILLAAASALGTLAYLTDTDQVENTFTVGSVAMSLDESDVKPDGTLDTAERVKENAYLLLPGHTYIKDPVVHMDEESEDCWVFVKVENGIDAYEAETSADYTDILGQIAANGWSGLEGAANVYYKPYTKGQDDADLEVFEEFKIDGMANTVAGWDDITPQTTVINVTGYAVQKDGFATAKAAWEATFGKDSTGGGNQGGDSADEYPADPNYDYTVYFDAGSSKVSGWFLNPRCKDHWDGESDVSINMVRIGDGNIWKGCFNATDICGEECSLLANIREDRYNVPVSRQPLVKGVTVFYAN